MSYQMVLRMMLCTGLQAPWGRSNVQARREHGGFVPIIHTVDERVVRPIKRIIVIREKRKRAFACHKGKKEACICMDYD
jgi:hypothetical protein